MKNLVLIFTLLLSNTMVSQSWVVSHSSNTNAKSPVITLESGNLYYSVHNETINNVSAFRIVCLSNSITSVIWDRTFTFNVNTKINHALMNVNGNIFLVGEQNNQPFYCLLNTNTQNLNFAKVITNFSGRIHKAIELQQSQFDYAFIGTNINGGNTTKISIHGRIRQSDGSLLWAFQSAQIDDFRTSYSLCEIDNGSIILAGGQFDNTLTDNMLVELNPANGAIISTNIWNYTYTYTQASDAINSNIDNIINIPGTNWVAFLYHIVKFDNQTQTYIEGSRDYGVSVFDYGTNSFVWDVRYVPDSGIGERGSDIIYNAANNELIVSSRVTSALPSRERFLHFINASNGNTNNVYNLNSIALNNLDVLYNLHLDNTNVLFNCYNENGANKEIILGSIDLNNISNCFLFDDFNQDDCNKPIVGIVYNRNVVNQSADVQYNFIDNQNQVITKCGTTPNACLISDPSIVILEPIIVTNSVIYNGKYLVNGRIEFSGNITIDITNCDFIFNGCNSGLYFRNGARLRANNSVFRPCNEDSYWEGITFDNTGNNKFHACVVKNAVNGLHLIGNNSETVITNNLFQNNFRGILFENSINSSSVASNTFDVNNGNSNIPLMCMGASGMIDRDFNGIRAINSNIAGSISQNNFVCQISNTNNNRMKGVLFENSTANITKNNFTNQEMSIRIVDNQNSPLMEIGANEIEYHSSFDNTNPQIVIINGRDNITFSNNKLHNLSENNNIDGIDVTNTSINILENTFNGFRTAIKINDSRYSKITQNEITNSTLYGIYSSNCNDLLVSCNTIKMKHNTLNNTIGLSFIDNDVFPNSNSKIISNCVFDSYIALYMSKNINILGTTFPEIRNNFLYNYYFRGMYFENCMGSVGDNTNHGRNTFYSNISGVLDVYSNIPGVIDLYYNYMLAPAIMPSNVTIYNNLQAHSTAHCANQVNLSQKVSTGNIISCDMDFVIDPIGGGGEIVGIENPSLYLIQLIDMGNVSYDSVKISKIYKSLDTESQFFIDYYYNYSSGNLEKAKSAVNQLIAIDNTNPTYRILLEKMNSLLGEQQQEFSYLHMNDTVSNYYAVSTLNLNPLNAYDYVLMPYKTINFTETKEYRLPEFNSLLIYPNPANKETNLRIDNYYGKEVKIRITDVNGKLLFECTRNENNIDLIISLLDYNAGVYIITVEIEKETKSEKLVIY